MMLAKISNDRFGFTEIPVGGHGGCGPTGHLFKKSYTLNDGFPRGVQLRVAVSLEGVVHAGPAFLMLGDDGSRGYVGRMLGIDGHVVHRLDDGCEHDVPRL